MSDNTPQKRERPRPVRTGILSLISGLAARVFLLSLVSFFLQLAWFIGSAFWLGKTQALATAQGMVLYETDFLQQDTTPLMHVMMVPLMVLNGYLVAFSQWTARWPLALLQEAVKLTVALGLVQLLRLTVFVLALPLFLIVVGACLVDGLVKRDIRKFQGARESAFTFHRMKGLLGPAFYLPLLGYFAVPFAVSPLLVLVPQAVMMGALAAVSAASFKKHL